MPTYNGRDFKIHYVTEGSGPAVVFAHGFFMDHTTFAPQFEDLPDTHRCIAWDMRGHGRSECPPAPWTMQDLVVDLIRFIEDLNAAPAHIVGMSIGGMIALRLAIQREDLVRSLVLIDTSASVDSDEMVEVYRAFQQQVADNGGIPEDLAREALPVFYGERYMDAQPEALEIHVDRMMRLPAVAAVEGLSALISRDELVGRLGEIRVPTLVVHGESDQALAIAEGEQLAKGIGGAEFIRVPDAGHATPLEAPDVVNEALAGFFARVKR